MLKDIAKSGVLNDAEQIIFKVKGKNPKEKTDNIKADNTLSMNGMAVCHKIPFGGLQVCMEKLGTLPPPASAWGNLSTLIGDLNGVGGSYIAATTYNDLESAATKFQLARSATNSATGPAVSVAQAAEKKAAEDYCGQANELLKEFDGCPDNLYFGFQQTNASISDNIDLRFAILTAASGAAAVATPRGQNLKGALNTLEISLGVSTTERVEFVDTLGITWVKSSGLDLIGWVEAV